MSSIALINTRAQVGVEALPVTVESHLSPGLPAFSIVGLPETAVKESRDRVRSALINAGFDFPARRITVNLAPADLPKDGGRFDLPIALGILAASGQLPKTRLEQHEFIGELALSSELRPVTGVLPTALATSRAQRVLVVPTDNVDEAVLCGNGLVHGAASLLEVCAHLTGQTRLEAAAGTAPDPAAFDGPCLSDVRGQTQGRRALEIAAAGNHSLLLCGPPGSGKSMLARRLPGLLPALDHDQAMEAAAVHSLMRSRPLNQFYQPPFRAPHHTASAVALVGGGSHPRPGEISMAHHGVLFMDELPEFDRKVLEVLREPLETGEVCVSRAARQAVFPARFQLVAAMNPCPCGYLGDPEKSCGYVCEKARRYRRKISGPLLDRIDLHVDVPAVKSGELTSGENGEPSTDVRVRVLAARQRQLQRQACLNANLPGPALDPWIEPHRQWLANAMDKLGLSARSLHRVIRVARTIADLEGADTVLRGHLREALGYRLLDRHSL